MVLNIYEGSENDPEEPADPNEVRIALSWLLSSEGTLDFEDSQWAVDADGENGFEFKDKNNDTSAYIPPGTDGDITSGGSTSDNVVRTRQANIPLTEIADGNTAVGLRKQIPSGKTLKILEVGVEDDTGSAPSGLTIEVQDHTDATSIVSENTRYTEGFPITSKSGPIDVAFWVANSTGGSVNASGYVLYTME